MLPKNFEVFSDVDDPITIMVFREAIINVYL